MAEQSGYRDKYFEEKFSGIYRRLDDIKETLESKASAGFVQRLEERVTTLEKEHQPCPRLLALASEVKEVKKDLTPIKKATDDLVYYKNNPKQIKYLVVGFVCVSIIALIPVIEGIIKWIANK
jgi:hypothetical protein